MSFLALPLQLGMEPVRIACVRYLNTAPLIEGLEALDGVTLVPTVPSRIVDHLCEGEAEVGLASVVDAVRSRVPLAILPVGMIGSDGETMTVRVYSREPLERVTALHADTDSHTSVVLARLLLAKMHGATPRVVGFDARERVPGADGATTLDEAWPETVLLIGDKVVTDPPPVEGYPFQMDLGREWRAWTGLPMVYAAWMCRASEAGEARIGMAAALLDRQRRHNATRLDWIATTRAGAARWPIGLARKYLGELLRFDLDARARAGLERFVEEAERAGLLAGGALRFAPGVESASLVVGAGS